MVHVMSEVDKYSELKLVAGKATPGPWWVDSHGMNMTSLPNLEVVFSHPANGDAVRNAETGNLSHWRNDWDASYIATANPKTILELISDFDAQRLRADTAEAELAKANDKIDKAWRSSHKLDDKAYIPGAFDAWKRPVPQFLPYDFSGAPGTNATQYCNGWNDCGGYWKAHATEVEARLGAAEQRIASHESTLRHFATCADVRQVGTSAMDYVATLNPKPEAGSHE